MNPARDAAQRGADWLLAQVEPDGSLRDAPSLGAYYKAPAALAWSGHREPARAMLRFVRDRYLRPGGDLDGTDLAWYPQYRIYPHAWLTVAAVELQDTEFAAKLAGFLERAWNPATGGFRARDDGVEEIMTTSMAGIACLRVGRTDIARGVAGWLERMLAAQPDLKRGLWHVWRPGAGFVEGDRSVAYFVDAAQPKQWYFHYGISAALLAELSRVTGEKQWTDLGRRYLQASRHCAADVYRTPQSGKIGWGAAWTWARTRGSEELALVEAVVAGLRALQCGDGSWNPAGVYEEKPASEPQSRLDVTAEFVALLSQMAAVPAPG